MVVKLIISSILINCCCGGNDISATTTLGSPSLSAKELKVEADSNSLFPRLKMTVNENNFGMESLAQLMMMMTEDPMLDLNLSPLVIENMIQQYILAVTNEDVNLDFVQLVVKYGYPIERHTVVSQDGYILTMYRIPRKGPVAFLMHGLGGSADDWIVTGPETGVAYLLSSAGYDVWIGNARGNKYSRRHQHIEPYNATFWDFSWDEIGRYDLAALIDFALNTTGEEKLRYVGHSQGTTSFFVLCSTRPEYNNKISLMVALSAVAYMSNVESPIARLLARYHIQVYETMKSYGQYEVASDSQVSRLFRNAICGRQKLAEYVCRNLLFVIAGFSPNQLNMTTVPLIFGHMPSGAATKQPIHYLQGVVSGEFRQFDYGETMNIVKYGTEAPPAYPLANVTAPVAIFKSDEDWLAHEKDVSKLVSKLSNVVELYHVPTKGFNHLDFLFGKDVEKLIVSKLLGLFEKY